ncbi:MAG TPA: caspase family protein [Bradyrhizobium sp.]|uniref:caspase family protein n=1 Tax=Bradyrhizobium sp. TaxID=376 RepID=UPI002C461B6C|nr:caspase family protein [Bradyrhizobium sp.]HTB05133.1 caspase family protein [Bradyrhizobium sp.]
MKRHRFLVVFLALFCLGAAFSPASAGVKLALVLGNAKYEAVPVLENPANDAADLAQALRATGFEVIEQRDATRDVMAKAVRDFSERLHGADVALFFYAGHGLQMNGENYLLPVDARIESAADVRFNTINLSDIQQEMEGSGRANIIILDACRNNPFAEKLARGGRGVTTRGLGRVDATGEGSLIVYSTQPNNVALDGSGRNSPFTAALLKHVGTQGLEVRQMISRVRGDVLQATDRRQTPWDSSSLVGDVYLAGAPAADAAASSRPNVAPAVTTAPAPPAPAVVPPIASVQPTDRASTLPAVVGECDRLTAPPDQTAGPVVVKTDWNRAVVACEAALQAEPREPHFQFALGKAYFFARNYIEAARHLALAADAVPEAENALGYCFEKGLGVVKNDQKAFELYSKAAAAGSPVAMESLGGAYANGLYVKQDFGKALDWLEKSVEAGNADALQQIGNMYFNGHGVPKDYAMAAQYFQQAADLNNGYALRFLANMYEVGLLGSPNPEKAGALRLRAQQVDPDGSRQPESVAVFRKIAAENQSHRQARASGPTRRYVIYRRIRIIGCGWTWC